MILQVGNQATGGECRLENDPKGNAVVTVFGGTKKTEKRGASLGQNGNRVYPV